MIKNIVFDIGRVLMGFDWPGYMTLLFGADEKKISAISEVIWSRDCWQALDCGEIDGEEVIARAAAILPQYAGDVKRAVYDVKKAMSKHEYAIPWIKEIKSMGKNVYYLSNYSEYIMNADRSVLDFLPYTDGGVFSCEVKTAKPDRAIYRILCDKYGLKPEECLFTDDMPANVKAAEEFGMTAVLFEDYAKTYPIIMDIVRKG